MKKVLAAITLLLLFTTFAHAAQTVDVLPVNRGIKSSTTTATTTAGKCPATPLVGRRAILIHNIGSTTAYIGASDVSSTNGLELEEDDIVSMDLSDNVDVYVRTAASTADIRTLEIR